MKPLFLCKVSYLNQKKQVVLEFYNSHEKFVQSFKFFPSFFLPKEFNKDNALSDLVKLFGSEKIIIETTLKNSLEVKALDFQLLQKFAKLVRKSFNFNPLILSPERQFLINKKWSFFDSFAVVKNTAVKLDDFNFPLLDFKSVFNEREVDMAFLKKLVLSNLLIIPLSQTTELLESPLIVSEKFLEKTFFKSSQPLPSQTQEKRKRFVVNPPKTFFSDFNQSVDFSSVWTELLTFNYFNLGFETINCDCCKPLNFKAVNVLPSTKLKVKFSMPSSFFESFSNSFSQDYHYSNNCKIERLQVKNNWQVNSVPVGPFNSNSSQSILFNDALRLEEEGLIDLVEPEMFSWHCLERESFLSKELRELISFKQFLENVLSEREKLLLSTQGLNYDFFLENDLRNSFNSNYINVIQSLLASLHYLLTNPFTNYYSFPLASNLSLLQELILFNFKEFARNQGEKAIQTTKSKALIDSSKALTLARKFALKQRLPKPRIS
ncbi:MAG: hypothetical protein ABH821_03575 [archaeon]